LKTGTLKLKYEAHLKYFASAFLENPKRKVGFYCCILSSTAEMFRTNINPNSNIAHPSRVLASANHNARGNGFPPPTRRRQRQSLSPLVFLICAILLCAWQICHWLNHSWLRIIPNLFLPLPDLTEYEIPSTPEEVLNNPLVIPKGQAKALPSIRNVDQEQSSIERMRSFYGGAGDKKHLGGFTDIDTAGISPRAWKWMVQRLNIQSVLDVGCGRGISTTWFHFHGLSVLCVEGSHDAREQTMLPDPDIQMIEHDFSRGPWWPGRTFDAVWCIEFLEHDEKQNISINICCNDRRKRVQKLNLLIWRF
jgi:Methyltransferase domain